MFYASHRALSIYVNDDVVADVRCLAPFTPADTDPSIKRRARDDNRERGYVERRWHAATLRTPRREAMLRVSQHARVAENIIDEHAPACRRRRQFTGEK